MNVQEKISQLKSLIRANLTPLINRDYWLLEVPYYTNVGDTLIWQGELDFLKYIPFKNKGMFPLESFKFPQIPANDLIIFQGGGNFGDLWTKHHDFKMRVVEKYPNNEFLFLPQTVYFQDENNQKQCAEFLSHYKVTICARDQYSYDLLKKNFSNSILLVPDMAFCMNISKGERHFEASRKLLLKRIDAELKETVALKELEKGDFDISDWPTMYDKGLMNRIMYKTKQKKMRTYTPWAMDVFCRYFYRPYLIKTGVEFINSHTQIYSTRLHGAILSLLLNKDTVFIDNSYGKNSQFYDTWLTDCDSIRMLD